MIGRLIERLFVSVRADMSDLSRDLSQGMAQTRAATNSMAMSWDQVSTKVDELTRSLGHGKITQSQYTSQMNRLASTMKVVAGSYREAQHGVWGYASAAQAAARQAAVVMDPTPVRAFARSAGQARMQMMNLGYQLNDIGMTLASGMNPMTVMIQQGSQIAQIYGGQGGVSQAFKDLSKLLGGLARRLWPLAVIAAGFKGLQVEINKTTDEGVTFGDTFLAVFQVLAKKITDSLGPVFDWIAPKLQWVWGKVVSSAKWVGNILIRSFLIVKAGIKAAVDDLPAVFKVGFWSAVAMALEALYHLGGKFEGMMGGIAQVMNDTFGTSLDTNPVYDWVSGLEFARYQAQATADAIVEGSEALQEFKQRMAEIKSTDYMGQFFEDVRAQAIENSLARIADGMEGVGGAAERAAEEIQTLMEQLQEGLETAADNFASVFGRAFDRLAEEGKFSMKAFLEDLRSMVFKSLSDILQSQVANVFKIIVSSIGGGLGSPLSQAVVGAFGGGINGRAVGGVSMPWESFIAGERGAELIERDGPAGARRVTTAGRTRQLLSQSSGPGAPVVRNTVAIAINNYSREPVHAREGTGPDGQQMIEVVVGEVKRRMGQGEFDSTLGGRFGLSRNVTRR